MSYIGYKHREESKRKMSEAQKGRTRTPEQRTRISIANKLSWKTKRNRGFTGKHCSIEHKKKLSESQMGRKRTKESRERISIALMGRNVSEETRKKLSDRGKLAWKTRRTRKIHGTVGKSYA